MAMRRAQSAGALIGSKKNCHPTIRLDHALRTDDALYRPAEQPIRGDAFVRKMVSFGRLRPSTGFQTESRAARPMLDPRVVNDASDLPPTWSDSHADPREGSYVIKEPEMPDPSFVEMYKNHALMTPSERYREFLYMKESEKKWREDKRALSEYKKRSMILTRTHSSGILGVDSLTQEGTENFGEQRENMLRVTAYKDAHDARRKKFLTEKYHASDEAALRHWGVHLEENPRGSSIPTQNKFIKKDVHPSRFLDTHTRLFPILAPKWDPERAVALMMHDCRGRGHDLISGKERSYTRLQHRDMDAPDNSMCGAHGHGAEGDYNPFYLQPPKDWK